LVAFKTLPLHLSLKKDHHTASGNRITGSFLNP